MMQEAAKTSEQAVISEQGATRPVRKRRQRCAAQEVARKISPRHDGIDESDLPPFDTNVMKDVSPEQETTATARASDSFNGHAVSITTAGGTNAAADPLRTSSATGDQLLESSKRLVQCNICKRRMTESRLANHIRLLHLDRNDENSSKIFKCDKCGKSYANKYTFDTHVKTHTEGRPLCPECGSTFASTFSLFRHRAMAHKVAHNYTVHPCDLCDRVFFSSSELALHKQRHKSEKTHECPECKKMFSAKGNLRIHMRTHAKQKIYKCDLCDHTFSHPYSLVTHRRIHTNELPFKCGECGKNFRSKHQLDSHANVHKKEKPFSCSQCTKSFRSRTAFKMHQDEHLGLKRFHCQFCGRKFQCQANKSKHERRHLGVKRFKCEKCDKAFIEKQELKNHSRVHDKPAKVTTATDKDVS